MYEIWHWQPLRFLGLVFGMCLVLAFVLGGSAYALDYKVAITNGTASHCLPYPSCYEPYEIDIKPGDTVTWINGDNKTHTATAGTPNNGPVGMFDSGPIPPGHSYTQFFGTLGKFPYYDRVDMWPSGIVNVGNPNQPGAQIGWVNGTLSLSTSGGGGNELEITKQIENTGKTDANSVLFRLRILNDSGFLFYDNLQKGSVPANQNKSVSFVWESPKEGNYRLNFDAENLDRQNSENNEVSYDLISVSKSGSSPVQPITTRQFALNNGSATVPEFGQMPEVVLLISVISLVVAPTLFRLDP